MNEWLAELKAGDRVVIANNYHENLSTVSKVTATLIICGDSRFRKLNGYATGQGDSWNRTRLVQPLTSVLERIEGRQLRDRLSTAIKDGSTTLAALRAMYAAYKDGSHDPQ